MSFIAKKSAVHERQLKVQSIEIPLSITGHATPASVVAKSDADAILFLKTEGTNRITSAAGALDSGETAPTFVAAVDATGKFAALVKIGEQIDKAVSCLLVRRDGHAVENCKIAGISSSGDKIGLDCDTAVDLSAANLDASLELKYIVKES